MSHEQRIEALRARLAGVESVDISAFHVAPKGGLYVAEPQVDKPVELGLAPVVETAAVAREREMLKAYFEECAAILVEAGVADAEREAARLTVTFARNARFLWVSLRSALEGQTDLLTQLAVIGEPQAHGVVYSLPLGPPSVAVSRDRAVVRQGTFVGAHAHKGTNTPT